MTYTRIIATIGPASENAATLGALLEAGMDIARLNFAWDACDGHEEHVRLIRGLSRHVPILQDLPGPRIQEAHGHTHDSAQPGFGTSDAELIACAAHHRFEWVAVSFTRDAEDIERCRAAIAERGAGSRVMAKIERAEALDRLDEIIAASDAVMVARGDLSSCVSPERMPEVQADIVRRCHVAQKPVVVATGLLESMIAADTPSDDDARDITRAVEQGASALLLAEETAMGTHPARALAEMARIIRETNPAQPIIAL